MIGSVTLEKSIESGNCAVTLPQFDDRRSVRMLAFRNGLEYHNSEIALMGNYFCTLCSNLM